MTRTLMASLLAVSVAACNQPDEGPIKVENTNTTTNTTTETSTTTGTSANSNTNTAVPVTPKGTVSGQVLKSDLSPLAGAKVDLTIGSTLMTATGTTAADGSFAFTDIPAGSSLIVTISAMGYGTARTTAYIPVSAGAEPLANANDSIGAVVMAELDGRQAFRVTGPTGQPAGGARARLAVSRTAYGLLDGQEISARLVVEATVDNAGLLTFTGIPRPGTPFLAAEYALSIEPLDANADGVPESSPHYATYTASSLLSAGSLPFVRLDYPQAPTSAFAVDSSNVATLVSASDRDPLRNMVKVSEAIRVTFNHPVQNSSIEVKLTDELAKDKLDVTVNVSSTGNTITIAPAANAVRLGQEYNLFIRAVSAQTGAIISRTGFFFAGDPVTPQQPTLTRVEFVDRASDAVTTRTDGRLDPGERVYVYFSTPVLARNSGGGANVEVFFDVDIDGNAMVGGNATGEIGNATFRGLNLLPFEPNGPNYSATAYVWPQFAISASGYSTRFYFDYNGAVPVNPAAAQVFLKFTFLQYRNVDPYETIWATPVTQDFSASLTALPQNTFFQ